MRLIDADALKEFYGKWANRNTEFMKGEVDGYIDAQPTIEAEPVRHGRWEHSTKHLWHKDKDGKVDMWQVDCGFHNGPACKICGEGFCEHCEPDWAKQECKVGHYVCSACGHAAKTSDANYCPNCGAKMDGGAENAK